MALAQKKCCGVSHTLAAFRVRPCSSPENTSKCLPGLKSELQFSVFPYYSSWCIFPALCQSKCCNSLFCVRVFHGLWLSETYFPSSLLCRSRVQWWWVMVTTELAFIHLWGFKKDHLICVCVCVWPLPCFFFSSLSSSSCVVSSLWATAQTESSQELSSSYILGGPVDKPPWTCRISLGSPAISYQAKNSTNKYLHPEGKLCQEFGFSYTVICPYLVFFRYL